MRTETAAEIGFDDRCRADGSDIGRKAATRRCTTETVRIKNARSGRFNIHLNQTELLKNSLFNSPVFTDKYKTGITFVDDEHRKLFEIISDTNDLIHDQLLHDKYDEIMRLLAELRDYTELHFSEEEALMERIHYPELPSQKRAHAAFVDRLVNIDLDEMEDLDDNQQVYLLDLIQFLLNWLANHILACDKKIGEYMRENHISE